MQDTRTMIPLTRPVLDSQDRDAVARVVESGWIAAGVEVLRFEDEFAVFLGRRHALACHSGASALELALRTLGIGPGDEVIVPSLTFTATAAIPILLGAEAVFADVTSENDLTLAPESVAAAFSPRTKAVVFVPYGGYAGSLAEVARICADAAVPLIEDACHAPGATADGRKVGTFGRLAAFSFHTTKNMTTAEGGMVVFDDRHLLAPLQELRSHGLRRIPEMTGDGADYVVERIGHNHRMSDMAAALGLAQLERLPAFNRERVKLSCRYDEMLAGTEGLIRPFASSRASGVGHLYPVLLPEECDRRSVRLAMRERGIETAVHYVPLHRQPAYRTGARALPLPVTEAATPRLLTLPLYGGMTADEQGFVVEVLTETLSLAPKFGAPYDAVAADAFPTLPGVPRPCRSGGAK